MPSGSPALIPGSIILVSVQPYVLTHGFVIPDIHYLSVCSCERSGQFQITKNWKETKFDNREKNNKQILILILRPYPSPISLTEQGQYIPNHPKFDPATWRSVSASDKRGKALNNSSLSIVCSGLALIHQSSGSASKQEDKRHIFAYICERISIIQAWITSQRGPNS